MALFSRSLRMLPAALVMIALAGCEAIAVPSGLIPAPLDPFLRHEFEGGCCSVAGTLELRDTCVGIREDSGDWAPLLWPASAPAGIVEGRLQIELLETRLTVGEPTKLSGYWVSPGGSQEATLISEQGFKERCSDTTDYFIVTDTGS